MRHNVKFLLLVIIAAMFVVACRSEQGSEAEVSAVQAETDVSVTVEALTQADCQTTLLEWLGDGMTHGTVDARTTDSGCDMTFDIGGAPLDTIKRTMAETLSTHGYMLASVTPARRGERFIFANSDGMMISLLIRGSDAVKVDMPDAEGQVYVHWYQDSATEG